MATCYNVNDNSALNCSDAPAYIGSNNNNNLCLGCKSLVSSC